MCPANVETMFYVRETPWHGLGVRVEEAVASEEALKVAGLDWKVENFPIYDQFGKAIPNYVANTRNSDSKVLGIVTDKYKIVQNNEAFAFTDNLLGEGVRYETAGSLNEGRKIWLLAQMPEQKLLDDKVSPYLVFTNSHDGTGAIKVAVTPIRVVCQNTLNLALAGAKRSWACKHMGNIDDKLEEAKRTLGFATEYMKKLGLTAEEMARKVIQDAEITDFIEQLFPIDEDSTQRKIENIMELRNQLKIAYLQPDIKKFRNTQWGIINAVSDMVTHAKPLRNTDNYKANLFDKVIDGHSIIDRAYDILKRVA